MNFVDVSITKHTVVSDVFTPSTATRSIELWAKTQTTRNQMG